MKNPAKRDDRMQNGHDHFIGMKLVLAMIRLKKCSLCVKQQSLAHSAYKCNFIVPNGLSPVCINIHKAHIVK